MKRVLLRFFMDVNFGDDMMICELLQSFPEVDFYVCSKNSLTFDIFSRFQNLHRLDISVMQAICSNRKFDAYLTVGGSILNLDRFSEICYQLKESFLCAITRLKKMKTIVLGANISSLPIGLLGIFARTALRVRMNGLSLITVRDSFSYKTILPYANEKVHLYPDIVFDCVNIKRQSEISESKKMGISVFFNRSSVKKDKLLFQKIAEIADQFLKDESRSVELFAFDTEKSNESYAMLQVYRMIKYKERVQLYQYYGDTDEMIRQVSRCDCFLPIRFHALVLCLVLGIPFVPVVYANKAENLLNDLNYHGHRVSLRELAATDARRMIKEFDHTRSSFLLNAKKLKHLRETSRGHFRMFKKMLDLGEEEDNINSVDMSIA